MRKIEEYRQKLNHHIKARQGMYTKAMLVLLLSVYFVGLHVNVNMKCNKLRNELTDIHTTYKYVKKMT